MNAFKKNCIIFLFLTIQISFLPARQVLFISSYSESFNAVNLQKIGISKVLKKTNIKLDIEYMNMKQYNTNENLELFYTQLRYKLSHHTQYDAILVGDDAALRFAEAHQQELFNGLPIVFFCINNIAYAKYFNNKPLITGTIENFYLKDTIDIALRFQPQATHIIGIFDNTLSGIGDQQQFAELQKKFPNIIFSGINSSNYSASEFKAELETIAPNTIVLYLSNFEDKNGNHYSISDSVKTITNYCSAPVYRTGLGGIGEGLVGGKVVSYIESGYKAASMVVDILNGKNINTIPVETQGESKYIFDYKVLKKFGIDIALVPHHSEIFNKPPSFIELYKPILIPFIVLLTIILVLFIIVFLDNIRRRRFTNKLKYQAEHDYLTNLPNRRSVFKTLQKYSGQHNIITLMLLDIDDFKNINDTYGHICGDNILIQISTRLNNLKLYNNFTVFRLAGDEFLIITVKHTPETINDLIETIRQQFVYPIKINTKKHFIKCCIGIVQSINSIEAPGELLMKADLALQSAKKKCKNSFCFFCDSMKNSHDKKNKIKLLLNEACVNDDFYILYQPQIDLLTEEVCCYEALVRLKNNQIGPSEFIPIAEESDIILTIGRIVTKKVIKQMAKWQNEGKYLHPVSINYSSKQQLDTEYFQFLKDLLEEYDISPSLIEIEITEGIFLDNDQSSMKLFRDFASLGISLALDDFGTGYSSISYLTYIPVKKIKLDKSLIDIYLKDGRENFVKYLIGLTHSLGMKITVEGVETKEQYEKLKNFSCDYIQGYYFSKPLTKDEILKTEFK